MSDHGPYSDWFRPSGESRPWPGTLFWIVWRDFAMAVPELFGPTQYHCMNESCSLLVEGAKIIQTGQQDQSCKVARSGV